MLVIEDDPTVSEVVGQYLRAAGFVVDQAIDGLAGLRQAETVQPDLVVLDRMLPLLDGIEVCRRIRVKWGTLPVIMLTALGEENHRIEGLEVGADDYLVKPFSPRELVLRVQSVLRRSGTESIPEGILDVGEFSLNLAAHEIRLRGEALVLTAREFDLLAFLIWRPSKVLTREELLRSVWGWEFEPWPRPSKTVWRPTPNDITCRFAGRSTASPAWSMTSLSCPGSTPGRCTGWHPRSRLSPVASSGQ